MAEKFFCPTCLAVQDESQIGFCSRPACPQNLPADVPGAPTMELRRLIPLSQRTPEQTPHVWSNEEESFIAVDLEDAKREVAKYYAQDLGELMNDYPEALELTQLPDDYKLRLAIEGEGPSDPPFRRDEKTCREWADGGRGFLASSYY